MSEIAVIPSYEEVVRLLMMDNGNTDALFCRYPAFNVNAIGDGVSGLGRKRSLHSHKKQDMKKKKIKRSLCKKRPPGIKAAPPRKCKLAGCNCYREL